MKLINLLIAFLSFVQYSTTHVNSNPIAFIGQSAIMGERIWHLDMEVDRFLGIPYANPPVGDLRFQKPEPIRGYPDFFKADQQPPACHQYTPHPYPWYVNSTDKSEDCLYMNIWTPIDASPLNTKSVFYWIPGGAYRYGSIRDPLYDGTALAATGDMVVVTVNYRLGVLGFLTSNTDDAPGNAGLWDTLEGLKWVNQNIQAFGGDPARITIAGESVGSTSVGLLAISPLSRGLFSRQILQSLSPASLAFENKTNNIALSQFVSKELDCASDTYTIYDHPTEVIECLKDVDPVVLSKVDELLYTDSLIAFQPQYSYDDLLPENPRIKVRNGEFQGTDVLSGVTKDEGCVLANNYEELFGFFGEKVPHVNKTIGKEIMRRFTASFPHAESIVDYYLNDCIEETAYDDIRNALFTCFGDLGLLCATMYYAEKSAEIGNRVYVYHFVHIPSTGPWAPGIVGHYSEVQFVFGKPVLYPHLYQPDEIQISLQMMKMWSNFVKYGDPGFSWPLYEKDNPVFKYLGPGTDTQKHGLGPHVQNCNFWRPYFGF